MPDEEKTKITKDDVAEVDASELAGEKKTKNFEGPTTMGNVMGEDTDAAPDEPTDETGPEAAEPPSEAENATPWMPLDHKYELAIDRQGPVTRGVIVKAGTTEEVDDWVIFRAQDKALVPMLRQYFKICSRLESPEEHLQGIAHLIERVKVYQDEVKVKVAD